MPKEEWGVKRVCPTTGKRFYDLNKNPIVSPYTGEVVEMDTGKSRSITADEEDAETKKMKSAETDNDSEVLDDDDVDVDLGDDVLTMTTRTACRSTRSPTSRPKTTKAEREKAGFST